jgi:iron complex outermembrane receptor protein
MMNKFKLKSIVIAMGMTCVVMPAISAEDNGAKNENNIERIAVVGTRSAPRSIADSPVPIDIIGGDELGKNASSDMIDMLQGAIPSFSAPSQPISDAATLIRPINLRGLPSDSTLILVNGKRRHRASVISFAGSSINDGAQGPDVSVIPSIAIKQVEVLRDGAAAQYGSDAIAGVINFQLKDDSEGGSLSVRRGEYYEGDGTQTVVDGNIGLPFTEDGFANISFQYKNSDPTSRSIQRNDASALIAAGNNTILEPAQVWGQPEIKDDITVFTNIGLDLGDDKAFYLFGNYSERDVSGGYFYRNPQTRGNVFSNDGGETLLVGAINGDQSSCATVPANVANVLDTDAYQTMVADPNCFSINQLYPGGYTPTFGGNIVDTAIATGVKGDIKSGILADWFVDLSIAVGRNASEYFLDDSLNPSLGLDGPTSFKTGSYIQLEKSFNFDIVRGFDVGLEELVNVAAGVEWREESFQILSGEQASWEVGPYASQGFAVGSHGFPGFGPDAASTNSRRSIGAYLDVEVYLNEDFLVGTALRYEDFSSFGDTFNYKLTAQYAITDTLSIRASHSTGFRAPTIGQENVINSSLLSNDDGELVSVSIQPPTTALSKFYGGSQLTPEESVSYAVGAVYKNDGFFLTLDYYNIEVTDRLSLTSNIEVRTEDHDELKALGIKNPALLGQVRYFTNTLDATTQGIDIVSNYSMKLLSGVTLFSLAYNWNETTVDKFDDRITSTGKVNLIEDSAPDHRATFTISHDWEDISMFIRGNYFGEYMASHAADTSDWGSEIGESAITIDAQASYFMNESLTLSFGVNNLLDKKAQTLKDSAYGSLGGIYYENGPYDFNGGFYYVKATYNF